MTARGWCEGHYRRWRDTGDPGTGHLRPHHQSANRTVEGCPNRAWSRGWCTSHYSRWQRHGHPTAGLGSPVPVADLCAVTGCPDRASARGWLQLRELVAAAPRPDALPVGRRPVVR